MVNWKVLTWMQYSNDYFRNHLYGLRSGANFGLYE
jgi:hypothetical protein